jgi:glycerol-3-phosphate acyltransferase PlsX
MKLILDAMGSDQAPMNEVGGAVKYVKEIGDYDLLLVGDRDKIETELAKYDYPAGRIEIRHASEVISMEEKPAEAIRRKRDSSIVVSLDAVREGRGSAFVSAGNTGAVVGAALIYLKRIKGIRRPGLVAIFPTIKGASVVLDVGAFPICTGVNLYQYAVMGQIYADCLFQKKDSAVGLLSVGEEEGKGHEEIFIARKMISSTPINYVGHMEGGDILRGRADCFVTDGFTGNALLKFAESVPKMVFQALRDELTKNLRVKIGAWFAKPAFEVFRKAWDYAEYGGAPLLGVNGSVIIAHGKSSPKAIRSALRAASSMVSFGVVDKIEHNIESFERCLNG